MINFEMSKDELNIIHNFVNTLAPELLTKENLTPREEDALRFCGKVETKWHEAGLCPVQGDDCGWKQNLQDIEEKLASQIKGIA